MEDKQFRLFRESIEQCCPTTEEGLTETLLPRGLVSAPVYYSAPSSATPYHLSVTLCPFTFILLFSHHASFDF